MKGNTVLTYCSCLYFTARCCRQGLNRAKVIWLSGTEQKEYDHYAHILYDQGGVKKKHIFIHILWIRGRGQLMWISKRGGRGSGNVDNFFSFYNIIVKYSNVDKGLGGGVRQCG